MFFFLIFFRRICVLRDFREKVMFDLKVIIFLIDNFRYFYLLNKGNILVNKSFFYYFLN